VPGWEGWGRGGIGKGKETKNMNIFDVLTAQE
jgi:hypothetical protein